MGQAVKEGIIAAVINTDGVRHVPAQRPEQVPRPL